MILKEQIEIPLEHIQSGLILTIYSRTPNSLFDAVETALENNEARFQLVEGCFYDYDFNLENICFETIGEQIVQSHPTKKSIGRLSPNIFVGTLSIPIINDKKLEKLGFIELEVQSVKSGYRDDYRDMLELITEKCTDLLLQSNSPVSHHFEIDYTKDNQILYQKFAFINSVIGSDEFVESIHRIVTNPVTKWTEMTQSKDIRQARRFSNTNIKEFQNGTRRSKLPDTHYLQSFGLETLPERITTINKTDSIDTPENRFIKHALETFLKFSTDVNNLAKSGSKLDRESLQLIRELESQLHHSVFKEISRPTTLKLNSPVLQRKEGYREVLRIWLMFDLAAKLIWTGGDDIYHGGKKDIATLYEYWLFFKLLDLFQSIFNISAKDIKDLIKKTNGELDLQLKQGNHIALRGVYDSGTRKLEFDLVTIVLLADKKNIQIPGVGLLHCVQITPCHFGLLEFPNNKQKSRN